MAKEGWGAELLGHQDPEGTWAEGLYGPKWTSTTYTLLLLRRMGLAPDNAQAQEGVKRLQEGARLLEGGVAFRPSSKHGDDGSVYFELQLDDAWVWDMYRPARFVKSVKVMTFRDVNIEELEPTSAI